VDLFRKRGWQLTPSRTASVHCRPCRDARSQLREHPSRDREYPQWSLTRWLLEFVRLAWCAAVGLPWLGCFGCWSCPRWRCPGCWRGAAAVPCSPARRLRANRAGRHDEPGISCQSCDSVQNVLQSIVRATTAGTTVCRNARGSAPFQLTPGIGIGAALHDIASPAPCGQTSAPMPAIAHGVEHPFVLASARQPVSSHVDQPAQQ